MKRFFLLLIVFAFATQSVEAQGFYKDVFMDGGIKLTSLKRLPSCELLDLSMEYFCSQRRTSSLPATHLDSLYQREIIIGSEMDLNGILLYPDGEPRFRVLYLNGGKSAGHCKSLGEEGKLRLLQFYQNGGSYVGTCAGAFASSSGVIRKDTLTGRDTLTRLDDYLKLWPGYTSTTGVLNSYTGMFIPKHSPLLRYYDFGGDYHIDSVRHNGGCYIRDVGMPEKTEVLLRYDHHPQGNEKKNIHNAISSWAYKGSDTTGRIVAIGSHPEAVTSGDRLKLMAALISYALDGQGCPKLKAELEKGVKRNMYKSTRDRDPAHTMIGDRQIHHFRFTLPAKARNITISLDGDEAFDLFLYLKKGEMAFRENADAVDLSYGAKKTLSFEKLEAGVWYIGVTCDTTVETSIGPWGIQYSGNTTVLNGVPYSIKVDWE